MASTQFVCVFDRQENLVGAVAASRERGLTVVDAYAPYPVHGLSTAMGLEPSRLPWICCTLGMVSGAAMLAFQHWTSAVDWPINVGGRPWNSFPAFVPVAFEVIVLVAALGTVAAFIVAAGLRPWRHARVPDPRVTDDRFALVVMAGSDQRKNVEAVMARFGAASVEERPA
jgi:Protein of unknown function (DUF3341)